MAALKRLTGAYLIAVAVVVAVYFIVNTVIGEHTDFDVLDVWYPLDILMVIGLALGLVFNYIAKRDADAGDDGGAVTRRYLAANVLFYMTAAVTILFLHNWIALLALGADSLDGNHQAWVIWAFVDTALPITLGVTGCRLWREASQTA